MYRQKFIEVGIRLVGDMWCDAVVWTCFEGELLYTLLDHAVPFTGVQICVGCNLQSANIIQ